MGHRNINMYFFCGLPTVGRTVVNSCVRLFAKVCALPLHRMVPRTSIGRRGAVSSRKAGECRMCFAMYRLCF